MGGHEGRRNGGRLVHAETLGLGYDKYGGNGDVSAETERRHCDNLIANLEVRNVVSHSNHHAAAIATKGHALLRKLWNRTQRNQYVLKIQRGGSNGDLDFSRSRRATRGLAKRHRVEVPGLPEFQAVGTSGGGRELCKQGTFSVFEDFDPAVKSRHESCSIAESDFVLHVAVPDFAEEHVYVAWTGHGIQVDATASQLWMFRRDDATEPENRCL